MEVFVKDNATRAAGTQENGARLQLHTDTTATLLAAAKAR